MISFCCSARFACASLREEWNRQGYALQHRKSAGDRMLVKRPLLITEDKVLTGFKEADWEKAF